MYKFQAKLTADGYCDNRAAGFCATATKLPNKEHGLAALCVKNNILNIYDVDLKNNLGKLLYKIELNKTENLKIKSGLFFIFLKFDYLNNKYSFTNIAGVKYALDIIKEEADKR